MAVTLNIDTSSFARLANELHTIESEIPAAQASALNRTVTYAKTQLSKEIRNKYAIKAKDLNDNFKVKKASKTNLKASIDSSGRPLTIYNHFNVSPKRSWNQATGRSTNRNYKVKVKIKKDSVTVINGYPSAFVQMMKNGTIQVVRRVGTSRYPIKVLRTLSIPQMASNEGVYDKVSELAKRKLEERIQHEVNWRLERAAQRTRR